MTAKVGRDDEAVPLPLVEAAAGVPLVAVVAEGDMVAVCGAGSSEG